MKKLIYIMTACLGLSLASCDDFLDVSSPDKLSSENYWRNDSDVEAALAVTYGQLYLGGTWSFPEVKFPVEEYRTDLVYPGKDAYNYAPWVDLYNFTNTKGNSQTAAMWSSYYAGIMICNQVIDQVGNMGDKISSEKRVEALAEAKFMRAWYHMQLLLNWKQIIIRDHYVTSGEPSEVDHPLNDRVETWEFICDDLKQAAEGLPARWTGLDEGRGSANAANAYLGMAYLTRAYEEENNDFFNKAVEVFNKVEGLSLEENFTSMFNGMNKNCDESIFEIQFTQDDSNGAWYKTQFHNWINSGAYGGWDEIHPSEILMNEYKKEGKISTDGLYDARLYASVFFDDDYFNGNPELVLWDTFDDIKEGAGGEVAPWFRKLLPTVDNWQKYSDVNVMLMRYGNVLLMKAEALNETGNTAEAVKIINEVRRVHGHMPAMKGTSQDDVRAQIEHERMLEFPLENSRWYDLRRWGKTAEAMKADGRTEFNEDHLFFPVPESELNYNGGLKK